MYTQLQLTPPNHQSPQNPPEEEATIIRRKISTRYSKMQKKQLVAQKEKRLLR